MFSNGAQLQKKSLVMQPSVLLQAGTLQNAVTVQSFLYHGTIPHFESLTMTGTVLVCKFRPEIFVVVFALVPLKNVPIDILIF